MISTRHPIGAQSIIQLLVYQRFIFGVALRSPVYVNVELPSKVELLFYGFKDVLPHMISVPPLMNDLHRGFSLMLV